MLGGLETGKLGGYEAWTPENWESGKLPACPS